MGTVQSGFTLSGGGYIIAGFMRAALPERIDPWLLADRAETLVGELPGAGMARLAALVRSVPGPVAVRLEFGRGASGQRYVEGRATAAVCLTCQRCLEACTLELDVAFRLALVAAESQIERLDETYEPLLLEQEATVRLSDLVEDELLLGLPPFPRHPENTCRPATWAVGDAAEPEPQTRPFAGLDRLLDRDDT